MTDGSTQEPRSEPGTATAEGGEVLLDGPDAVAVSMQPDAAEETGRRLIAAAQEARLQRAGAQGD